MLILLDFVLQYFPHPGMFSMAL